MVTALLSLTLYFFLLLLFTTVITSRPESTINDYDISFLRDDDINDTTVMKAVKSLLIPTIVMTASCSLFLDDTNKK